MLNRREFAKTVAATAAVAVVPAACANSDDIRVWQMGDCDYIAARSGEEALAWYREWLPGIDVEEVTEAGDDIEFREGDAHDETLPLVTARDVIDRRIASGLSFPCYLCTDGHYC
jgi:uncharacterized lipoprotein NlpE involved in copper resistance